MEQENTSPERSLSAVDEGPGKTLAHGIEWNREQIDLVKRTVAKDVDDNELALFMHVSKRSGLDPFARQIYAVSRWSKKDNRNVMAIQTSIDGFRLIAQRSGEYLGQKGPYWADANGKWYDVWIQPGLPAAARVGVFRKGFKEPVWGIARFDAYKQEGQYGLSPMWKKMPDVMIAKCAEALALRKAFPQELSGLYTGDEMDQADVVETEQRTTNPPKPQGTNPAQSAPQGGGYAPQPGANQQRGAYDPSQDTRPVTEPQRKRLYALCQGNGWDDVQVKDYMLREFNCDSSKNLTRAQYQTLCDAVEGKGEPAAIEVESSTVPASEEQGEFGNFPPNGY